MLTLFLLTGCAGGDLKQLYFEGDRDFPEKARPYLMFLSGVPGPIASDIERFDSLRRGGFTGDIEVFKWNGIYTWWDSLEAYDYNRERAKLVAERITEVRRAGPDRPLHILAVSGGPLIAAWALADLPPDVMVDKVIMTSPGMSPKFDLSKSLRHVNNKCYVLSSTRDVIVSSLFSKIWGGVDRVYEDTAGRWGFHPPDGADKEIYAKKLVNIEYRNEFAQWDNYGTHMGASYNLFVEFYTAKLLILPWMP